MYIYVTSLKIRNHYIVANLTNEFFQVKIVAQAAWNSKFWKKYLGIILMLFILSILFDKDYTRIAHVYIYIHIYMWYSCIIFIKKMYILKRNPMWIFIRQEREYGRQFFIANMLSVAGRCISQFFIN